MHHVQSKPALCHHVGGHGGVDAAGKEGNAGAVDADG